MIQLRRSPEKIRLPRGFAFSAIAAGIKVSGRPDLALAEATNGAAAAALFTSNRVVAAPVTVDRKSLQASGGRVRAVIVNSGNANCATGIEGIRGCELVCREAAKLLNAQANQVFPSSTGIIGVQFPAEKITVKLNELIAAKSASDAAAESFARAIMTTDTRPKIASAELRIGKRPSAILGVAKGAGMIHPQLATMLVYLFTDVLATPRELRVPLRAACDSSFNCMSIDGDTSTNDTVLLLASGESGAKLKSGTARKQFARALNSVCQSLAEQIISDGEGVEHVLRLRIEQARSREEALVVARTIAHSLLVKTAWAGADPNWGRILAAIGRCGIAIDPRRVQIFIGEQQVCRNGMAWTFDEKRAHGDLAQPVCEIRVHLARGRRFLDFLTTDLTAEYVGINADYST
jgi:glutamate N-acetyltransferase / amino-acid N-acetyltransferase